MKCKKILMMLFAVMFCAVPSAFADSADVPVEVKAKGTAYVEFSVAAGARYIYSADETSVYFFISGRNINKSAGSYDFYQWENNAYVLKSSNLTYSDGLYTDSVDFTVNNILSASRDIYTSSAKTTVFYSPPPEVPVDEEVPVVTSDLAAGTYNEEKQVILTVNEPATIYYTVDGSVPTTSSAVYSNPIRIAESLDLKYFAVDPAGNSSEVVTVKYTISLPSDRDGDGISDAEDIYPDDPTNTPPAYDETSEAEDNKKTQSVLIMLVGLGMTALVMGGKGLL